MKRFHYAWVILVACTLITVCNVGLCSTVISAYLPYIEATGISDSDGSMMMSIRNLFAVAGMFLVSKYYRFISIRNGVALATILGGVATLIFSVGGSVPVYYLGACVFGTAYALGSAIPTSLLLRRWFNQRRGLALGICASGSGIASIFVPVLVDTLVQRYGLRAMFWCVAGFIFVSAVVSWLLVRNAPEEKGITAYGEPVVLDVSGQERDGYQLPAAAWGLVVMLMVMATTTSHAGYNHLSVLMTTSGYGTDVAARCLSLFGIFLTAGKFIFGAVADRVGTKWTTTGCFVLLTAGLLLPNLMDGVAMWPCLLACVLLGLGYPPLTVGIALWAMDVSTAETYEKTLKRMQIMSSATGIFVSALPGRYYDAFGNYQGAFRIIALCGALSIPALWMVYRVRKPASEKY